MEDNEFNFSEAVMYLSVSCDLSDLENVFYDVLVFFSPISIDSLYENFPNFNQNFTRIAAYGESTAQAVLDKKLQLDIRVPDPNNPHLSSMAEAIDQYIKEVKELEN